MSARSAAIPGNRYGGALPNLARAQTGCARGRAHSAEHVHASLRLRESVIVANSPPASTFLSPPKSRPHDRQKHPTTHRMFNPRAKHRQEKFVKFFTISAELMNWIRRCAESTSVLASVSMSSDVGCWMLDVRMRVLSTFRPQADGFDFANHWTFDGYR